MYKLNKCPHLNIYLLDHTHVILNAIVTLIGK
jgi:hypothetical protein